jgi:hypothetical protein
VEGLFSTAACGARGHVRWAYTDQTYTNFDAVFFFCVLGLPVVPVRAAHVFRYRPAGLFEREYEWLPLRWTPDLLLLAWARRATLVLAVWAVPLSLFAAASVYVKDDPDGWALLWMCLAAWVAFPLVWATSRALDRENRRRRRVMGDWKWGSVDPMTVRGSYLAESDLATPNQHYGAETWTAAAENCVRIHNWWGGLFAARMAERFEDAAAGRELAARIMSDPEVVAALPVVERDQSKWHALLGPGRYGQ